MEDRIYLTIEFDKDTTEENVKAFFAELTPITKELADVHNAHGYIEVFVGFIKTEVRYDG